MKEDTAKKAKIVRLVVRNMMKLKAVLINPLGNIVVLGGKNGQGKSCVLNAIEYAFAGKNAICDQPIRSGEKKAFVEVTLEDLIIKRIFTESGSVVTVTSLEGAKYPSPQAMLDKMYNALCFDPLKFSRMDSKKQLETLKALVGLDFSEQDAERKHLFDERSIVNREVKILRDRLDEMEEHTDIPQKLIDVAALALKLEDATALNTFNARTREEVAFKEREIIRYEKEIEVLEAELNEKRMILKDQIEVEYRRAHAEAQKLNDIDTATLHAQISGAASVNHKITENRAFVEIGTQLEAKSKESVSLGAKMNAIDTKKTEALSKAEFPVPGLSFAEETVLLNDIPLSQASSAELLRVSVAMGLKMNPELNVMLCRDASLLDDDSKKIMAEMAEEADAQIWEEVVGEGGECQIIIEDGTVKGSKEEVST